MKFILVAILVFLVLIQTFSKWVVVAEYKLNKNYIAQNLCINKARPKLHCNGRCQMMKKLAEEEKQNSSNNNSVRIKIQELLFSNKVNCPTLPALTCVCLSYGEAPPISKNASPVSSIFHPPALC